MPATVTGQAIGLGIRRTGAAYPSAARVPVHTSQDWRQDGRARGCACGCELNLPAVVLQHPGQGDADHTLLDPAALGLQSCAARQLGWE